jgi:hypothetical protein
VTPRPTLSSSRNSPRRCRPLPRRAATAQEIAEYVRGQLDANHAGLTLIRSRRRLKPVAATDELAEHADRLQYELEEGPCRDSS